MKSIILAIAVCAVFTLTVSAQNRTEADKSTSKPDSIQTYKKLNFNIGLDEGIPVNYVSKYASFITGASVQAEYKVFKELGVTLSAGYLYFLAKDGEKGLSFIPVMAGLKYYFVPKFYLSGQLGASAYSGSDSDKTLYLTYAQGIGYKASKYIDILAKYQGINTQGSRTYSFAGLRIAYTFGKGK
jgi:hypothetical protein